eukprot:COSAG02_NODE_35242_length_471_cov_1.120968_1_plen_47_part_10
MTTAADAGLPRRTRTVLAARDEEDDKDGLLSLLLLMTALAAARFTRA